MAFVGKPRTVERVLLRVSREKNVIRSDQLSEQQVLWVCRQLPNQLAHWAMGKGVKGTCHFNKAITMASSLQLTEHTASIHTLGVRQTELVFIHPVRCRWRSGQVGGGKGDERKRWDANAIGKGTDYLEFSGLA